MEVVTFFIIFSVSASIKYTSRSPTRCLDDQLCEDLPQRARRSTFDRLVVREVGLTRWDDIKKQQRCFDFIKSTKWKLMNREAHESNRNAFAADRAVGGEGGIRTRLLLSLSPTNFLQSFIYLFECALLFSLLLLSLPIYAGMSAWSYGTCWPTASVLLSLRLLFTLCVFGECVWVQPSWTHECVCVWPESR